MKSTYEQKRKEAEVAALEQRRMDGDALPQSVDDYEKLIMSSPQSSFVWVQYMAFQIGLTEVDKARRLVGPCMQFLGVGACAIGFPVL